MRDDRRNTPRLAVGLLVLTVILLATSIVLAVAWYRATHDAMVNTAV